MRQLSGRPPKWTQRWYPDLHALADSSLEKGDFAVEHEGLTYGCRFSPTPGADRLIVSMRAFPEANGKPGFAREGWGGPLQAHILSICDPSLLLDSRLKTGVFLGTESQDPIPGVIAVATAVAAAMGTPSERIVYWGASGGGFGALMAACRTGGIGVSFNAQIDLMMILVASAQPVLVDIFRPNSTAAKIAEDYRSRTDVGSALVEARERGLRPHLLIMQNLTDKYHLRRHFREFCGRFGIGSDGGMDMSGDVTAKIYEEVGGHGRESLEVAKEVDAEWLRPLMENGAPMASAWSLDPFPTPSPKSAPEERGHGPRAIAAARERRRARAAEGSAAQEN